MGVKQVRDLWPAGVELMVSMTCPYACQQGVTRIIPDGTRTQMDLDQTGCPRYLPDIGSDGAPAGAKGTSGPQALLMGLHDDQMKNKK